MRQTNHAAHFLAKMSQLFASHHNFELFSSCITLLLHLI